MRNVVYKTYKLKNDKILEIHQDDDAANPRKEWDNLGTMICWHKRYDLGDKHYYADSNEMFCDILNIEPESIEHISQSKRQEKIKESGIIILPLYLYDHSGITMSTGSFIGKAPHAEWDSMIVGYIYITKQKIEENGFDDKWLEKYKVIYPEQANKSIEEVIENMLKGEVEVYDQYLRGNVYGFVVKKRVKRFSIAAEDLVNVTNEAHGYINKDLFLEIATKEEELEEEDSCWGFYGSDIKENGIIDNLNTSDIPEEFIEI
jgi:hypothetical protein